MKSALKQAVSYLKQGGVVSFPTETVYALATNAFNEDSIKRIYSLKGRDFKKPLAIMFDTLYNAQKYVEFNEQALKVAKHFCPGAISLVLPVKKNSKIPKIVNNGMSSLSIRIPDYKIALDLLSEIDFPIVATSVNPSAQKAAVNSDEVRGYFPTGIDYIVEGHCPSGEASTIIDFTNKEPKLIRQGEISFDDVVGCV